MIKGILPEHIYVMDNADSPVPPDDTKRVVRCIHPGIKYIFIPKGLKTFALWKATNDFPSTVKYILHLDDDTVLADSIRFNEATFDDPTVSSISYNIRVRDLSGRSSADSAASWLRMTRIGSQANSMHEIIAIQKRFNEEKLGGTLAVKKKGRRKMM